MGVYSGPDVSESGLVLALDGANLKSFKGEPTTNLIGNGDFSSGLSGWSDYVSTTKTILSSKSLPFSNSVEKSYLNCKSQSTAGPGGNYGGIFRDIGTTTAGITYTISYWARSLSGSLVLKFSFQTGAGDENNLSHSRTLTSEWVKYSHTVTLNFAKGSLFIWNQNISSGIFEITNIQLEAKSSPTTFVNGTRGDTVATGGGWADMSGNGNHGQLFSGVRESSDSLGALVFDGTDDYITISSSQSNILTVLSMECWFKSTGTPLNGYHVLFQKEGGYSGGAVYGLRAKNVGSKFTAMICYSSLSTDVFNLASITDIVDNTWYYIASTLDSSYAWKIYVNGVLENSTNLTSFPFQNSSPINIGAGDGRYTNGNIGQIKVYNRTLTASEVQQNFNATRGRYGV